MPRVRSWLGALLAALTLAGMASPVQAATLAIGAPLCHAVTAGSVSRAFACVGAPTGYQDKTLWLRADLIGKYDVGPDPVLLLHMTRFDRLTVLFGYADGHVERRV